MMRVILKLAILFFAISSTAFAAPLMDGVEFAKKYGKAPEGQFSFWKLIFAEYGKDTLVFHHRSHPGIIYSVLDVSDYNSHYQGRTRKKKIKKIADKEIKNIKTALLNLSKGKSPKTKLEKRIVKLFAKLPGGTKKYKEATKKKQIRYQTGIKERFQEGLERSGRYLYAMEEIFRRSDLPIELTRLPLVESSFDYNAYSSVGAAGIWQFVRSTGRQYMIVDGSIDERKDPIHATRAAAKYLSNAYSKLGRWPLALTSYNHGVAGVSRAIKQTGSRNIITIAKRYKSKTFGFASSNFYGEFIAALEVEQNQSKYFKGLKRENPLYFDEVRLAAPASYKTLLKYAGVSDKKFELLNPSFKKNVLRNRVKVPKGFLVKFPENHGASVIAKLGSGKVLNLHKGTQTFYAELKQRKKWTTASSGKYKVKRGDTIGAIARRFKVSQRELMEINGIRNPKRLIAGKTLAIPGAGNMVLARADTYRVKKGDNLSKIAKRFGTTASRLKRLNPKAKKYIYPGQKIRVR